jgi:hypothetical protein
VEFFGSLRYRIISSANRDILTVSLPICIPFISSCLIALAKNSRTMLNRSGNSGHPCLVLDFRENVFSFSPLSMTLGIGLSYTAFKMSSLCLLKVRMEISSFLLPASLVHLCHATPLLHVHFQFLVYFQSFSFFLWGGVVSPSRGLCWFIPGVAVGIPSDAWCSSVGLPDVSQAGLETASGDVGAVLFSQCKVAWRNFVRAGGLGC